MIVVAGPKSRTARPFLAAAAVAAVLTLGLPWAGSRDSTWYPGYISPGICYTVYDSDGWASVQCDTMINYGVYVPGSGSAGGYTHPMRVLLFAAAVCVFLGYRRAERTLVNLGVAAGLGALFIGGVHIAPGQIVLAAGLVALVIGLRRAGLFGARAPDGLTSRVGPRGLTPAG